MKTRRMGASVLCVLLALAMCVGPMAFGAEEEEIYFDPVQIESSAEFQVALYSDGTVWTWGRDADGYGVLGCGDSININEAPTRVKGISSVVQIEVGSYHVLALKEDGSVWAWGINRGGQLGIGDTIDRFSPVQVSNVSNIISIAANAGSSYALDADGNMYGWGYDYGGESRDHIPEIILSEVEKMFHAYYGSSKMFIKKIDGSIWAWGYAGYCSFGDTRDYRPSPERLQYLENIGNIIDIAHASYFALALLADGTVWGWGLNTYGQLGNGTSMNQVIYPIELPVSNVEKICVSYMSSYLLKSDGTVWSAGFNSRNGRLGLGINTTNITTFTQISNFEGIESISTGGTTAGAYFIKNDGSAWGCGDLFEWGEWSAYSSPVPLFADLPTSPGTRIDNPEDAIATLVDKGIITVPDYWLTNYTGLEGVDQLLIELANFDYPGSGVPVSTVPDAINALYDAGSITELTYWLDNYHRLTYLDNLFLQAAAKL